MKLTIGITEFSDDVLLFAKQFGVSHVKIMSGAFMDEHQRGPVQRDPLRAARKIVEDRGLKIGVALLPQGRGTQHWNIRLGKPERKREIEDVCESIAILGDEGIPVIEYVFNLAAVWGSTSVHAGRGGARVRRFNYDEARNAPAEPGFAATAAEVWERIAFFLERAVPAAENAGVKLACHVDDPPVPTLLGETRVLGTLDGLQRLIDTVPSPANGLNFCQGTITEMGVDTIAAIHRFGGQGKIHHVHFRNVKGAIPHFDESFIDDGDVDMFAALKAYKEVGYDGPIMPDHVPTTHGDNAWGARGRAYALGYMRAMMRILNVIDE